MSKIEEARKILSELNVPKKQQADLCCYVLLAMSDIKEGIAWTEATNNLIRIHDVLVFTRENYGVEYAETAVKHSENRQCIISEMQLSLKITAKLQTVLITDTD